MRVVAVVFAEKPKALFAKDMRQPMRKAYDLHLSSHDLAALLVDPLVIPVGVDFLQPFRKSVVLPNEQVVH